jgi:hypothetical protein
MSMLSAKVSPQYRVESEIAAAMKNVSADSKNQIELLP